MADLVRYPDHCPTCGAAYRILMLHPVTLWCPTCGTLQGAHPTCEEPTVPANLARLRDENATLRGLVREAFRSGWTLHKGMYGTEEQAWAICLAKQKLDALAAGKEGGG